MAAAARAEAGAEAAAAAAALGVKPCRLVRLAGTPTEPLRGVIARGARFGGATVLLTVPSPCFFSASTVVEEVTSVKVELERYGGVAVFVVRPSIVSGREEDYLVYPAKLVEEVEAKYMERLASGKPPVNPGVLFYGAPGTGKSTLAELLGHAHGLVQQRLDSSILSEYMGKTEERIRKLLVEAETTPSLVFMDECEWLLAARRKERQELSGYMVSLSPAVSLLLQKMQEWKNRGVHSLIAATTNVQPSDLDQAFLRPGRFGKPIYIPIPDYESLKVYFELHGLRNAEELARQGANAGISMAKASEIVELVKAGKPVRIEPERQRGYARLVPPFVEGSYRRDSLQQFYEDMERALPRPLFNSPYTRVIVSGRFSENVAPPLISYYLAHIGKPTILLWSDSHGDVDEALSSAEYGAVLLVRAHHIDHTYIHLNANVPVVFFANRPLDLPGAKDVSSEWLVKETIRAKETALRLLCDFYEVKYTEDDVRSFLSMPEARRDAALLSLHLFARSDLKSLLSYAARL